jgi:ATP-dependent DNA helicase PIF1
VQVAAGWYRDPWGQAELRWWDGAQWTGSVRRGRESSDGVAPDPEIIAQPRLTNGEPHRGPAAPATSATLAATVTSSRQQIVLTDEFRYALALLDGGRHVFLTGKAGTGKSTLIREFMAHTTRKVVVAAPTGIAALNVSGYTIHRLFGFSPTTSLEDVRSGQYRPARFSKTLASLDTLIVDEASMIRADLFDMLAGALEHFGPSPGTPFGGVQLVLVGDLYQLPPVVQEAEMEFFSTVYETPYFFSAHSFRRDDFPTVSLTKVFRQLGDDRMTAILNEIREGVLVGHAQKELNAKTDPDFVPPDDEFWLTLATTNRIVSARNRELLDRLPGQEVVRTAKQSGDLSLFDPPADKELRFKVGAQVMMLANDQAGRWVNGTIGRVTQVCGDDQLVVTVTFTEGHSADVRAHTWEATRPVVEGRALRHEVIGTYTQLPFKLAWAITIHKSQGQTVDRLVVDLAGGTFAFGQLYVAISRCTSLNGLVLKRSVLPKDLKTDTRIARFLRGSIQNDEPRRYCAIGLLTVGDEGRMSRPRPVEIAVAFDDGTAVTTVVNPQRDLANARQAYGIAVSDVLLAPTLAEAWGVIAPMLAGCTPIGTDIDEKLGLIDFELKRLGLVTAMPIGVDAPSELVDPRAKPSEVGALQQAVSVLSAFRRSGSNDIGSTAFGDPEASESVAGYILSRDPQAPTPVSAHLPALTALLDVSRRVSEVLLGEPRADTAAAHNGAISDTSSIAAARHSVADQLRGAASRVTLTDESTARLREAEQLLGIEIIDGSVGSAVAGNNVSSILVPGARVCFTGTAQDSAGRVISRDDMTTMATAAGLTPVNSVTKAKCEVVVCAEIGSQSGKARRAQELGKPVISVGEFLAWADAERA